MARALLLQGEIPEPASRPRWALAAKGFRPFFLLAALFAVVVVPAWLLVVVGGVAAGSYLPPADWHAHEMVFGFAAAVIAGFLLTAVGNWTQRETLVGAPLLALSGLWVAGRLALALGGWLPRGVVAAVDGAFLPALLVVLARPILAARSRRNYGLAAILGVLSLANLAVHLDALGVLPGAARRACLFGVDLVVLVIAVIAGRVLPMFTRNATDVATIRSSALLDRLALGSLVLVVALDAVAPSHPATAAASGAAGLLSLARARTWGTRYTARHPLLWILHAGYLCVPLGLVLRAVAATFALPVSLATHALTVGAIGCLTLGMMARVGLGHTGRPLAVGRAMTASFAAAIGAVVARVGGPLVAPAWTRGSLVVAGALWTAAFALYVAVYATILTRPRADGKAG